MRSISFLILAGILFFLLLLSWLGYNAIKKLSTSSSKTLKRGIKYCYWIYSIYVVVHFTYLFIYPQTAASSVSYKAYFFFNIILVADIFSKIILSISYIIYSIFQSKNHDRRPILWIGAILTSGIVITSLYGSLIGNKHIQVRRLDIEFNNLPASFDGTKLVHVSDIHLGSFFRSSKLIERATIVINKLNPDYLLFTGDLVNNFSYELKDWEEELKKWTSKSGEYAILGNHDYGNYYHWADSTSKERNLAQIIQGHESIGFKLLNNSSVALGNPTDTIFLVGVENWGHTPFPQYADLEKGLAGIPENSFKILLTHDPAHWQGKVTGKTNIALTLSGHTHGMQLGIKFAGIEFSPMHFIREQWGGLYKQKNQYLYVNRGFGIIGINWRIDMRPEITLITLKRSKINGKQE